MSPRSVVSISLVIGTDMHCLSVLSASSFFLRFGTEEGLCYSGVRRHCSRTTAFRHDLDGPRTTSTWSFLWFSTSLLRLFCFLFFRLGSLFGFFRFLPISTNKPRNISTTTTTTYTFRPHIVIIFPPGPSIERRQYSYLFLDIFFLFLPSSWHISCLLVQYAAGRLE